MGSASQRSATNIFFMQPVLMDPLQNENGTTTSSDNHSTSNSSSSSESNSTAFSNSNSTPDARSQLDDSMSGSLPSPLFEDFASESGIGSFNATLESEYVFPGSSLSVLGALGILFTWFTIYPGISKEAFGQLLHILHNFLLPIGNVLPATYAEARTVVKPMLVSVEEYHCCVNDCVVGKSSY